MNMSYTTSRSDSITFSLTNAKHLAAKVATDLKRVQRFYSAPSDASIVAYENELILLLKHGYLEEVTYGFRRNDAWIPPMLRYSASDLAGTTATDDDPGRVLPGADITSASFYSYLVRSTSWHNLTEPDRESFETQLPFRRGGAPQPAIIGYLETDLTYSAGGRALKRQSLRAAR